MMDGTRPFSFCSDGVPVRAGTVPYRHVRAHAEKYETIQNRVIHLYYVLWGMAVCIEVFLY